MECIQAGFLGEPDVAAVTNSIKKLKLEGGSQVSALTRLQAKALITGEQLKQMSKTKLKQVIASLKKAGVTVPEEYLREYSSRTPSKPSTPEPTASGSGAPPV